MLAQRAQMAAAGAGVSVAEVSLTDNAIDATTATVYTFSGKALGVAASDRVIVVGAFSTNAVQTVSAITVGGVSATLTVAQTNSGGEQTELWQAAVPSGTTGDIVVTWTGAEVGMGIGVWRIVGAASTAHDTGGSAANPATDTLNIPANGVAIACAGMAAAALSFTWAGLTERYDAQGVEDGATSGTHSGASDEFATIQVGLTITATPSGAPIRNPVMAIASWGPS